MASRIVYFPKNPDKFVVVHTQFTNDLPSHIKGRAYWLNSNHLGKSQYHIVTNDGTPLAVEFINHYWYLISWRQGHYITKQTWKINKGDYETGWYHDNNPVNPDFQQPSPLGRGLLVTPNLLPPPQVVANRPTIQLSNQDLSPWTLEYP